jgi:hypothetical protein
MELLDQRCVNAMRIRKEIYAKFGITADAVVETVKSIL